MIAHVHSIESFGTVDGPGIRFVVFLKGCPMRCQYCHNPDTWTMDGGTDMSVEEILTEYEKTRHFYTHGGITVTGGEPLVQIDFVTELFEDPHLSGYFRNYLPARQSRESAKIRPFNGGYGSGYAGY